ncbi:LacI family DNA-binding transcriptional regulator [Brevibacillus marinus]|uniref:LacI family DNA-binding transcriptional regulator n=1 Tax=Brevibacillus marinus TaxID=2496837 RepID=UPI0013E04B49|nr:LacI family DNA-binding transcriptional regulator [Brevibacillus marinus]
MISSKDVAKLAGVSQATVSRVMNNPESVKPATRNKVLWAMQQLNYKPNLIARSLITNSTRTIALISGSLSNGFFVETTDSIVNLATKRGYKTMVFFEGGAKTKEIFDIVLGHKVDGILMSNITLDDPLFEEIEKSGIPYVFFNRRPRNGGNYVVLDNLQAGKMITHHLLDLGHKRLAYISGPLNLSTFYERKLGFETAMCEANVEIDPELVFVIDPSTSDVERTTWHLMQLKHPPTGIIYATDAMALMGMDTIMSMGYRIPEDISIAGIDDIKISSHHAVQLTTVAHHKFSMGVIATEALIKMIEEGDKVQTPHQIVLEPEIVVRKTTGRIK